MYKKGYIVPLTLLIISVAVALITAVVRESFRYHQTVRVARDRVEARLLALSSLELVLSHLSYVVIEKKETEKKEAHTQPSDKAQKGGEEKKEEALEPLQEWMLKVLPLINHWSTLEVDGDDIKGTITYYVASEQGKINLDELLKDIKQKGKTDQEEKKGANSKSATRAGGTSGSSSARSTRYSCHSAWPAGSRKPTG